MQKKQHTIARNLCNTGKTHTTNKRKNLERKRETHTPSPLFYEYQCYAFAIMRISVINDAMQQNRFVNSELCCYATLASVNIQVS